jgi:hypothetical protein
MTSPAPRLSGVLGGLGTSSSDPISRTKKYRYFHVSFGTLSVVIRQEQRAWSSRMRHRHSPVACAGEMIPVLLTFWAFSQDNGT